jgi:hypothetical protein
MIGAPNSAFVRIGNDSNAMGSDPGTPGTSSQRVQPVPGPVPNGEVADPSVELMPKQQKNLRILRDVLQQKLEAAGVGRNATALPPDIAAGNNANSAMIQAFIMKYGEEGMRLLPTAQLYGYQIEAKGLWGLDSYEIDDASRTITVSTWYGYFPRSVEGQADRLMDALQERFTPNPFISKLLGSLDLTKVQPAYILNQPEIIDEAILESAKKANDENVNYVNYLSATIQFQAKNKVRELAIEQGGQYAAIGVFSTLGNLFSRVKFSKFKAKEVHAADLEGRAIHAVPNRPLGRGITANLKKGTTLPRNLREQLAIEEAMANPTAGKTLGNLKLSDPRWPSEEGWVKMEKKIESKGGEGNIIVNYVYNILTGAIDDFKIVLPGAR